MEALIFAVFEDLQVNGRDHVVPEVKLEVGFVRVSLHLVYQQPELVVRPLVLKLFKLGHKTVFLPGFLLDLREEENRIEGCQAQ